MSNVNPIFGPVLLCMSERVECPECAGDGYIECDGENRNGYFTRRIPCPLCEGDGSLVPDPIEDTSQEGG